MIGFDPVSSQFNAIAATHSRAVDQVLDHGHIPTDVNEADFKATSTYIYSVPSKLLFTVKFLFHPMNPTTDGQAVYCNLVQDYAEGTMEFNC